jgi:lipid II:glycine glycyltransferase (peptidoglycan interpeptide bridge formation enzyme)
MVRELGREEYEKFALSVGVRDFTQSEKMLEVGGRSVLLGVERKGAVVAAGRFVIYSGRLGKTMYAPRGFLADYSDERAIAKMTEGLKEWARKHGVGRITIDPGLVYQRWTKSVEKIGPSDDAVIRRLEGCGWRHEGFSKAYDLTRQGRWVFQLSLGGRSADEIFAGFAAGHRNLIRKAERYGVSIRELGCDELSRYKKITEMTAVRRGFSDRSLEYYQKMKLVWGEDAKFVVAVLDVAKYQEALAQERADVLVRLAGDELSEGARQEAKVKLRGIEKRLVEAERIEKHEGKLVDLSAAMFVVYGGRMTYLFSGSDERYMDINAQYLVQWWAIQEAVKAGVEIYDFYGISGEFEASDAEYGVFQFKRGFDGEIVEYVGVFDLYVGWRGMIQKISH